MKNWYNEFSRRHFMMLIGSIAAFFAFPFRGLAMNYPSKASAIRCGCRITVVRRECFAELQSRYLDDPDTGPCSLFRTGQCFDILPGSDCPRGFCPRAWHAINAHLNVKARECAPNALRKSIMVSCSDGTRPVLFRIDINE